MRTPVRRLALVASLMAITAAAAEPREGEPTDEHGMPEWAREIARKFERKVSFEFAETPLSEAIAFLQTLTKVSMIIDPAAAEAAGATPITLKATNERLDTAYRRILALAGLDYALVHRAVFVSTPERLAEARRKEAERLAAAAPEWWRELRAKSADRKVTFEFIDTPFTDAIAFLGMQAKVSVIVEPEAAEAKGAAPVTLKVAAMPLDEALSWVCRFVELDWTFSDQAVVVSTPGRVAELRRRVAAARGEPQEPEWVRAIRAKLDRTVSFDFATTPLEEALAFLQALTRVNLIIEPEAHRRKGATPITLKVTDQPLGTALGWVCALADLDYGLVDHAVLVAAPEALEAALRGELETRQAAARLPDGTWEIAIGRKFARKVTFEFVDTPLSEALQFLQTLTETTIIADPVAFEGKDAAPITLKVTSMPLADALGWILRLAGLDYGLLDGAVFASTPERIAAARRAIHARRFAEALRPEAEWQRSIRRKLKRRISFEFVETPFFEATAFLQTLTNTSMVLDPRAGAAELPVTLKVTNMPLDAAFEWTCRLAGCDLALVDGAVFVSRPERAAEELLRSAERRAAEAARARFGDAMPEWEREIRRKLARKVTFEFVETPFGEASDFLRTLTELPLRLAPEAERARAAPVTLKVTSMPLADAIRWTCRLAGVDYELVAGGVRVGAEGGPDWRREIAARLARKATLSLVGTPALEALGSVQGLACVDVVLDASARERGAKKLWLEVADAPLADALARVVSDCGLAYALTDEAVFVAAPERITEVARLEAARLEREAAREGPVEWWEPGLARALDARRQHNLRDTTLGEALARLGGAIGAEIALEPGAAEGLAPRPVPLEVLHGMHAGAALRWLCRLAGADCRLSEKGVTVSTPEALAAREIDAALAREGGFAFTDMRCADVLDALGGKPGVAVRLDPGLGDSYNAATFTGTGATARDVLDDVTRRTRTAWQVRDGAVFVSTPGVISGQPGPEPEHDPGPPRGAERRAAPPPADPEPGPGGVNDTF